jgi:hypothetical protein
MIVPLKLIVSCTMPPPALGNTLSETVSLSTLWDEKLGAPLQPLASSYAQGAVANPAWR